MDYPPTPVSFRSDQVATPVRGMLLDRFVLSRWLGVLALACLAAGMGLTVIDIEMSSAPLMRLAVPELGMAGWRALGPLGILSFGITAVFVLALFSGSLSSRRRPLGIVATGLWLVTIALAAAEVNTVFEAVLATISVLNRGEINPDLTARLTPGVALWPLFLGVFLLVIATIASRRAG